MNSWQWFATVMDSLESQIRFGVALSNLRHQENDTTLHGNRFLRNLIDRTKLDNKKKTTTNRTTNPPVTGKSPMFLSCLFSFLFFIQINKSIIVLILSIILFL